MNSLRKNTLEERQSAMRDQVTKPRVGRPRKRSDPRVRLRVAALILLQAGRSPESVAAVLEVELPKLQYWIERGMPIDGDYPERGLSLNKP